MFLYLLVTANFSTEGNGGLILLRIVIHLHLTKRFPTTPCQNVVEVTVVNLDEQWHQTDGKMSKIT